MTWRRMDTQQKQNTKNDYVYQSFHLNLLFFYQAKENNNQNLFPNVHMAKFELQKYLNFFFCNGILFRAKINFISDAHK